jgi:hypothetical protein
MSEVNEFFDFIQKIYFSSGEALKPFFDEKYGDEASMEILEKGTIVFKYPKYGVEVRIKP